MSRTAMSVYVFVVVLCISLPVAAAQPLCSLQVRAGNVEFAGELIRLDPLDAKSKEVSNSVTVAAIGQYVADVGSFVHMQAIETAIDFAGSSLHWFWDGSQSALSAVYGGVISTVSTVSDTVTASIYWPASTLDELVLKLHDGTFDEFNRLVGEAGYSIVNVELGISVVPDLSIELEHVRNLDDIETAAVRAQVDEYLTRTTTGLGHLESAILRNLVNVGSYTGESEALNGIVVNLFPRQSAVLDFHVFGSEERRPKQLLRTIEQATKSGADDAMLEDRLSKIETALRTLNADVRKPNTTVK